MFRNQLIFLSQSCWAIDPANIEYVLVCWRVTESEYFVQML